jgi:hypothetical protein
MSAAEALRRLLELVQLLQLHREVSQRFLAGDASLAASRARIALWTAQQLERRLPPQCAGLTSSGWRLLARMTRKRSISARESDTLHAVLIRQYLAAAERLSAPTGFAEALDGLRHSLSAGKLAIQAQLQACFRALTAKNLAAD